MLKLRITPMETTCDDKIRNPGGGWGKCYYIYCILQSNIQNRPTDIDLQISLEFFVIYLHLNFNFTF